MANHMSNLRINAGFNTALDVLDKLNIGKSTIYQIEQNLRIPSPTLANKFKKLYQCTFDQIYCPYFDTISDKRII